ncbi:PAS domain S-box protein [Methanoregula sp.]|uniref:hybrid sensor histidine kinase/response regulator n=1 Tax=Methanoregula sp. TaxID=2052170 RepID=UPI00356AA957
MISVLYVDDEPELLEIGKIFLEQSQEFSVDTTVSALDALKRLQQKTFDAVLSDYQMPEMDGIRFLQILRSRGDPIPFIIFTGKGREEVILEALNSGVDFYLQKGGDPTSQFAELKNIISKSVRQKRAEEAQRQSEKRIYDILNHLPDSTFAIDRSGQVIAWNHAIEMMTGVAAAAILGKGDHEYSIPFYGERRPILIDLIFEDLTTIESRYVNVQRNGDILVAEASVPGSFQGKGAYLWAIASPLYDTKGTIIGAIESIRDITDRKNAEDELRAAYEQITATEEELRAQFEELKAIEAALRNSERRLQGIVQGSPIPQFVIDNNHKVISWNNALEQYSGVKAADVLGTRQQWRAFYPAERPCMADLLVEGSFDKIPEWYAGKFHRSKYVEGAYEATDFFPNMGEHGIWLYFTASTIKDPQGTTIGAVETLEDITAIKEKEAALKKSEEQYSSLFYKNYSITLLIDPESGRIVDANTAACTYYGYSWETITTLGIYDLNRLSQKKVVQDLQRARSQKEKHFFSTHYLSGGEQRQVEVYSGPITVKDKPMFYSVIHDITDKKNAEDALRASETKLSTLLQGSPIPQFVIDDNHRVIHWNRALEKYSGIREKDILGSNLQWRAFYLEERPCMADLLIDGQTGMISQWYSGKYKKTTLIEGAYEATDFFPHMGSSGTWLHFTAAPIHDGNNKIIGAVETLEDITEEKRAEEAVRQSEIQYRSILENIQDVFYRSDCSGNLTMISPSGTLLLGYDNAGEMMGLSIAGQVYANPEDRDAFLNAMNEKGFVQNYEVDLRKKDGSVVTVSTNSHFYASPDGTIGGVEGIFRDITDLNHTEKLLQESEALYRTIFNNTGAATIIIAPDTTILLANDEWEKITGVPKHLQEQKTSWTAFIDKDDIERMRQYHYARRTDPSLAPRVYECRLIDAQGKVHSCVANVLMIPGTSNSVASLVEITELKQAEEALRQINKKLNLMSSVTRHDILNQLTALSGVTELLKPDLSNPRDLAYISQCEAAIQNIERQITFTRLYQDIGVNNPEWQNVAESIRQAESHGSDGTAVIKNALNNLEIYADPLLVKVFYNLIENAHRHGEITAGIQFSCRETPPDIVLVCEDDGVGIPYHEKERIFDRGFGKHSGFGLFLAREILSITGLTIKETGEPGKGARFEIHIPAGTFRFVAGKER